jgi:hypothetical protein
MIRFTGTLFSITIICCFSVCLYGQKTSSLKTDKLIQPNRIDLRILNRQADLGYYGAYSITRMLKNSKFICLATVRMGKFELKRRNNSDQECNIDHLINYDLSDIKIISNKINKNRKFKKYSLIIDGSQTPFRYDHNCPYVPKHNIAKGTYILFLDEVSEDVIGNVDLEKGTAYLKLHEGWRGIIPLTKNSNITRALETLKKEYGN